MYIQTVVLLYYNRMPKIPILSHNSFSPFSHRKKPGIRLDHHGHRSPNPFFILAQIFALYIDRTSLVNISTMTSFYSHSQTVPLALWFFYQAWLAQNYLLPLKDYIVYPDIFSVKDLTVKFVRESDLVRFRQRWAPTFEDLLNDSDN